MSMADIAAAVVGLRETSYKEHQRVSGSLDDLRADLAALRTALEAGVDKRLAASAQALRDLERRIANEYERRLDGILMTLIEVSDRLTQLAEGSAASDDAAELQSRLASCAAPRDRLTRILEEAGVRRFDSAGEPYDPQRHEVVRREFAAASGHEYVLTELKPGYVREGLEHTLVRAKVIVAAPPATEGKADG
jgi:molecular chaperone GrpE